MRKDWCYQPTVHHPPRKYVPTWSYGDLGDYTLNHSPSQTFPAAAKSLQLCPTLCDPIDSSPPGSPVPGILQARTVEWVAISFSNAWKWKVKVKSLSRVRLLATPWTAARQAPLSMGFSRQESIAFWQMEVGKWDHCQPAIIHLTRTFAGWNWKR